MAARTFDLAPLARETLIGRGRPGGRQLRPVVTSRVRYRPGPDQAMAAIDADVVLVPEGRHREVDAR
jgi:hypothetical protein